MSLSNLSNSSFLQICADIDAYDLHSSWWNPSILAQTYSYSSFLFHGPAGVGKYAHAIHLLREFSPSMFNKNTSIMKNKTNPKNMTKTNNAHTDKTNNVNKPPPKSKFLFYIDIEIPSVSHCSNNPPQQFAFSVSDIHIEIDMEQLGPDPLAVWDEIFRQAQPLYPFFLCLHLDKTPPELMARMYTYMLPVWPPSSSPPPRFLFLAEQSVCIPESLAQMNIHRISFPRPTIAQYMQCMDSLPPPVAFPHEPMIKRTFSLDSFPEPNDIISIQELRYQLYSVQCPFQIEDPFGQLCDKMLDCIQSVFSVEAGSAFSIEDIRAILNEWAVHRICYEEGLWYILGKCLVMELVDKDQVYSLVQKWGNSGEYYCSHDSEDGPDRGALLYNYKRAEYMCAELVTTILYKKSKNPK